MYKIEHVINAKATAVKNGRETELFIGDWITEDELATLKVYGDKLIYRIDQNCTQDVCGIDIEAYQSHPSTVHSYEPESPPIPPTITDELVTK
jgi:hypothetical protein